MTSQRMCHSSSPHRVHAVEKDPEFTHVDSLPQTGPFYSISHFTDRYLTRRWDSPFSGWQPLLHQSLLVRFCPGAPLGGSLPCSPVRWCSWLPRLQRAA